MTAKSHVTSEQKDVVRDKRHFGRPPGEGSSSRGRGDESANLSRQTSRHSFGTQSSWSPQPRVLSSTEGEVPPLDLDQRLASVALSSPLGSLEDEMPSSALSEDEQEELVTEPEINTIFHVQIPSSLCPTHEMLPIVVHYSIKFSVFIQCAHSVLSTFALHRMGAPDWVKSRAQKSRRAHFGAPLRPADSTTLFNPDGGGQAGLERCP